MLIDTIPHPPQSLMFMGDNTPEQSMQFGRGLVKQMGYRGANVQDGLFLDVGCGYGRVALALLAEGFTGSYVGCDIDKERMDWLKQEISPNYRGFEFHYSNLYNERYNPSGTEKEFDFTTMLDGRKATTICMTSIFTHMFGPEIQEYLKRLRPLLADDGKLLFTAYVRGERAEAGIRSGEAKYKLQHSHGEGCTVENPDDPTWIVAFTEDWMRAALTEAGFATTIKPGYWTGEKTDQEQDWIVATAI